MKKGSKNKKKDDSVKSTKKGRGRPKKNATPPAIEVSDNDDTQEVDMTESFTLANDDIETCLLCGFLWSREKKKNKVITKCDKCNLKLHEPCLQKNSCPQCDAINQEMI